MRGGLVVDLSLQSDPQQLQSINEFTDSLVRELQNAQGSKPSKALLRELISPGANRALNMGGITGKRRFLDALTGNIHKFPLQEQQSLAKVYPVEISSEYSNLVSFVAEDLNDDDDDDVVVVVGSKPAARPPAPVALASPSLVGDPKCHAALEDLKRKLAALPPVPGPPADELSQRLLNAELERVVRDSDEKRRTAFFSDLRLNLFKLSDAAQKTLVERFPALKADIARLVESMAQEISRWLDEEKVASQRGNVTPLLTKLKALFKATLSVPFLATFKHLDAKDKKGKEGFLLKVALCLRTCKDKHFAELPELTEQVAELRKQFFYVKDYGELMEEWLNSRISQCNEEFESRVTSVLGTNLAAVLSRLKRTFRPGRWLSLSDGQLMEALYALFADRSFPKHVLTTRTITKVLRKVSSFGAGDFHIYGDIARLPPQSPCYFGPPAQDAIDGMVIEVLERLPPFPSLRKLQPSLFLFGRVQVEFVVLGDGHLVARHSNPETGPSEMSADNFFAKRGPEEFPNAAKMAVQLSAMRHPDGPPCTPLEMAGAGQPMGMGGPPPPLMPGGGQQRYEPYPGAQGLPVKMPPPLAPTSLGMPMAQFPSPVIPVFGLDDDEI